MSNQKFRATSGRLKNRPINMSNDLKILTRLVGKLTWTTSPRIRLG
jgi:hypothetical protein